MSRNRRPCDVISTESELEIALSDSFNRPLLLLKHSEWCGFSRRVFEVARDELAKWAKEVGCKMVVVQGNRLLSNAVAQRFGVQHETPQVLLVRNGRVAWHADHSQITSRAIQEAIEKELGTEESE